LAIINKKNMKRKLLIANWKLNHTQKSALEFFAGVLPYLSNIDDVDLAVAPTAPMLDFCKRQISHSPIALAAQNVFYVDNGAFTGEWSALQLYELSVKYCIIGHSERRKIFHETDIDIAKKVIACFKTGIIPIVCVGENAIEREQGLAIEIVKKQIIAALPKDVIDQQIIIAYEPIWAIGTGKTALPSDAQSMHKIIRTLLLDTAFKYNQKLLKIIYGGSVTPANIGEICSMPDIDGALVGGASLQASSFLAMVKNLGGDCCQ
jgi:triosephosphate isomerase